MRGRGAKVLTAPPAESQKASSLVLEESPDLSAIDKASFLEGLQLNYDNPLHSTAVEEDLNVSEGYEGKAKRKDDRQMKAKRHGAAAKRENTNEEQVREEEKKMRDRRRTKEMAKARLDRGGERKKKMGGRKKADTKPPETISQPETNNLTQLAEKPAKGRNVGARRLFMNTKTKSKSETEKSNATESQEESDIDTDRWTQKRYLSSEEELDDDTSWNPSPKRAKVYSIGRSRDALSDGSKSRKSSSGSASAGAEKTDTDERRSERHGRQPGSDLEVVLDAFLEFCQHDRETVESKAIKQSIDVFSANVREQLLEKISVCKELRVLKKENAKVGSLIHTKTRRLLDAKHELMRAERQVSLLQKEKSELQLKLADLRRSNAFLHDIRELNQRYLDYRHKQPNEEETYGVSSLPALLLETKHIQAAVHQLRAINGRMEKRQNENGTCN